MENPPLLSGEGGGRFERLASTSYELQFNYNLNNSPYFKSIEL